MKSAEHSPSGEKAEALHAKWQQYFAHWRDSLAECGHKPARKHVHAVRALTLRMCVTLDFCVQQAPVDAESTSLLKRWNKEGKKLRRVIAPIRNADVFLEGLRNLKSQQENASQAPAHLNAICEGEIEKLTRRLRKQRKKAIDELIEVLEERTKRLKRLVVKLEDYMKMQMPKIASASPVSASGEALTKLRSLAEAVPSLDSSNLHSFRKGVKEALYLAELAADVDASGKKLAVTLRHMHDAMGEWHDWEALTEEARRVLPEHDELAGLVPVLEKHSEERLGKALEVCRRSAALLLKMSMEEDDLQMRKPVASVVVSDEQLTSSDPPVSRIA